ncbi:preprotein translocase subunit SecG [Rariglobus hedericola]|uniref:Protein-export membrane protein SecG n=1 Tax=Rariglobus hedericola TaxID=2597822 RepID=A0A556QN25_9BACT|nr:preprotein translocase subunit SecG [Rariglobus hedericola]TSJ78027.1 preprotein translocase subunit SecG [Rariglobus hedericola]
MSILIGIFTFVLILVSVFLVLVVLAQKAKTDGGMGATLGGGATEAAFGADTGNVLTKATINAAVIFFVLTFGLYLSHIYVSKHHKSTEGQLPAIAAPAATTPAVEQTTTAAPAEAPAVTLPAAATAAPSEAAKP